MTIPGVAAPQTGFADVVAPVALALAQEKRVTEQINALAGVAREESDYTSEQFMQWFIKEQIEEVATMSDLLRVVERSPGRRDGHRGLPRARARRATAGATRRPRTPRAPGGLSLRGPRAWRSVGPMTVLRTVRVAAIQATPVILDAEATRRQGRRAARRGGRRRAQLAVLPETFVSLYPSNAWAKAAASFGGSDELWERMWLSSVDVPGPLVDELAAACARARIHA